MSAYNTPIGSLPSVTTVLGILDKPGLRQWYGKLGLSEAERLSEESAERGRTVHHFIKEWYESSGYASSKSIRVHEGFRDSFWKFNERYGIFMARSCEQMVWSKAGYAGTLDFIGRIKNDLWLLDWKTTGAIYMSAALQVSAYAYAFVERHNEVRFKIRPMVVRLREDGREPQILEVVEWNVMYQKFLEVLSLYNLQKTWRKKLCRLESRPLTRKAGLFLKSTPKEMSSASFVNVE